MKKIKPLIVLASMLFTVTIMVPALLVLPFQDEEKASGKWGQNVPRASIKSEPAGTSAKNETAANKSKPAASNADAGVEVCRLPFFPVKN